MSDRRTSPCCGRTLTSYWHLTYCSPQGIVKNMPEEKPVESFPQGQMVLDHDHLPPHLRLQNRMHLENRRLGTAPAGASKTTGLPVVSEERSSGEKPSQP